MAAKQGWQPELTSGWKLVSWGKCCTYGGHLPPEFLAAMKRADITDGQSALQRLVSALGGAAAVATASG